MTLLQLTYIMEIYNSGSMNKAAQALYVSQSTISGAIKEVEEELGISIFKRNNKGILLTDDGREFLTQIAPILEQSKKIQRYYADKNSEDTARLSISSQRYPFCAMAFVNFLEKQDDIKRFNFHFKECEMDRVIADVSTRKSDIGVLFLTDITEKFMKRVFATQSLEFHEIKKIRPRVFLSEKHPLANEKELTINQLKEYPYIVFEKKDKTNLNFSEEAILSDKYDFDKIIFINDRATAYNIIAHTNGFSTGSGVLPKGYYDSRIRSIPILYETESMRLGFIKIQDLPLDERAEKFIEILEEIMKKF